MSKILGIDLGTGNSCVAVFENGQTTIIPNAEGNRTTPSVVFFDKDGSRQVGQLAKRHAAVNPKETIHSVKRLIGKKYSEVQNLQKVLQYDIVEGTNGMAAVKIGDKVYTPEEISAMVLSKLKADAEAFIGEKLEKAVITVPAYFGDAERTSTKNAGKIAGLDVLRIINEPTAACLAYGLDKKDSKTIAVFDIGAGTSDISILEYGDGVFEVLATNGDSLLGGADIDEALMKYIADEFKKQNGVDILNDNQAKARLNEACEKAKCELSNATTTNINIPFISMNASGPLHLVMDINRAKFEQIVSQVFDKFEDKVRQCISDSKKDISQISEVIMVGGSTRIPYIQDFAKRIFNKDVNKSINPDEAVATGAAIQAAVLAGDSNVSNIVLLDVTSLTFGIETLGGVMTKMIPRGTTIPFKKTETFSTAADNQPGISVRVAQGEREKFSENKLIGNFELDGIPPAPRGVPQIEICFDIDANGILIVTAKDLGTGKENHISITSNSGLSDEEIDRMIKDAEAHKAEDEEFKKNQDLLNQADSIVFTLEKQIKENNDKIPDDLKSQITPLINDVKKYRDSKDYTNLKTSIESLQQTAMKIGEAIYKSSQASSQPSGQTNSDGTVDAEVVS